MNSKEENSKDFRPRIRPLVVWLVADRSAQRTYNSCYNLTGNRAGQLAGFDPIVSRTRQPDIQYFDSLIAEKTQSDCSDPIVYHVEL